MKISARNQLKGKVVSIENGSVNAIVHIDIGGGNVLSSTVSLAAVKELNLEVGKDHQSNLCNGWRRIISSIKQN